MKTRFGMLLVVGALALGGTALGQSAGLASLNGPRDLTALNAAPGNTQQLTPANGFGRAFRQQPPLVPHSIDGYQIARGVNKCLDCHSWPNNAKYGAPKVSETHYETRAGDQLDEISNRRWFCTQCHVPQDNAQPLVTNAFRNAKEMDGAFN